MIGQWRERSGIHDLCSCSTVAWVAVTVACRATVEGLMVLFLVLVLVLLCVWFQIIHIFLIMLTDQHNKVLGVLVDFAMQCSITCSHRPAS
jgi:hypothetical protein